ncbi:HEAT repeat protein [Aquisphaera giovannonii]|uniref:HEAT repeat protein n=1 Tax=Aquisphaera giovannonii TaxID=406548 RepID=A0A5B9W908_9BACT|nr:HEAT repeat domain-containing protein [Aquisphaera giovannonii]QEH37102.1 HEAT repeat protein [Aquisphaera giovannonii]
MAVNSPDRRAAACLLAPLVPVILAAASLLLPGCKTYVGTTAASFLGHVRNNPDPNARYLAYSKLGSPEAYDSDGQKSEAVQTLIDKFEKGREPVATRAVICRSLGELHDPRAHDTLVKAVSSPDAVIRVEACRALGKVGQSADATILAQVMATDNLEDARIAAIEGIAELKTSDPRIFKLLVDNMEHDDPAIRLAALNALRALTRKDLGTDAAEWRKGLKSQIEAAAAPDAGASAGSPGAAASTASTGGGPAAAPSRPR